MKLHLLIAEELESMGYLILTRSIGGNCIVANGDRKIYLKNVTHCLEIETLPNQNLNGMASQKLAFELADPRLIDKLVDVLGPITQ